jgi:ubiquinone/menaquinone biosynthesis C-methylase UbiE
MYSVTQKETRTMAYSSNETLTRTRAFFDERAAKWDTLISAGHGQRLRKIVETLPIQSNAVALDVGCGTGVLLPILADMLDECGRVVAVDVSFRMMQETKERIASLDTNHASPVFFLLHADVVQPPLREAAFDWVICNSCFPHFHDQHQAVGAMARLLKPGGRLVVYHTESRDAINELHRKVGGVVGGHELPEDDAMRVLVANAGLEVKTLDNAPDYYLLVANKHGPFSHQQAGTST